LLRPKKIRRLARRAGVELWSLDECHFQQHGSLYRMWVPPEIRTRLCCTLTRKSVACFDAVNLRPGQFVRTISKVLKAVTLQRFLAQLLRHRTQGRRIILGLEPAVFSC
jgi:hypothetical protein